MKSIHKKHLGTWILLLVFGLTFSIRSAWSIPGDNKNVSLVSRAFFGPAKFIVKNGSNLYAGAGGALLILDENSVSNPLVGFHYTPGMIQALTLLQNIVYIADNTAGLRIIDISNPASSASVGGLDMGVDVNAIAISGKSPDTGGG